jgi:hypothetical protein
MRVDIGIGRIEPQRLLKLAHGILHFVLREKRDA